MGGVKFTETSEFYLLFYSKSSSWWSIFSPKNFKHCALLIKGKNNWYILEPTWRSISIVEAAESSTDYITRFTKLYKKVHLTHIVGLSVDKMHDRFWNVPALVPASCANYCNYIMGLDIGFIFNPYFLWKKIKKLKGKSNFKVFYEWSIAS